MAERSVSQTHNPVVPGSSPALDLFLVIPRANPQPRL